MTDEASAKLWAGVTAWIKQAAAFIVAFVTVAAAIWYAVEPRINNWLDNRSKPIIEKLGKLESAVNSLQRRFRGNQRPFLEVYGSPLVDSRVHYPGGTVTLLYTLRRNLPCETEVHRQFINRKTMQIASYLTRTGEASRAQITNGFNLFTLEVKLPNDIPPGEWSYAPRSKPLDCPGQEEITLPPSHWFTVKARNP